MVPQNEGREWIWSLFYWQENWDSVWATDLPGMRSQVSTLWSDHKTPNPHPEAWPGSLSLANGFLSDLEAQVPIQQTKPRPLNSLLWHWLHLFQASVSFFSLSHKITGPGDRTLHMGFLNPILNRTSPWDKKAIGVARWFVLNYYSLPLGHFRADFQRTWLIAPGLTCPFLSHLSTNQPYPSRILFLY